MRLTVKRCALARTCHCNVFDQLALPRRNQKNHTPSIITRCLQFLSPFHIKILSQITEKAVAGPLVQLCHKAEALSSNSFPNAQLCTQNIEKPAELRRAAVKFFF
jgi:hypothetical protein